MFKFFKNLQFSLVPKLILSVGLTLLLSISIWAYFNIKYQKNKAMQDIVAGNDRLSNTILLGTRYAMMLNSRDDINQIIQNIGKQKEIENIRIYNQKGQIKFSNQSLEVDRFIDIKSAACSICHQSDPALPVLSLAQKTRIFNSPKGHRLLGIINPIEYTANCSIGACHMHPKEKKILGTLELVISLEQTDNEISAFENGIIVLAAFVFLGTSAIILLFLLKFVNRPINKLIDTTNLISKGENFHDIDIDHNDEMGQLFRAINRMGKEISKKQAELKKQRDEYQDLFELVPCLISIQDRDYKLISYNQDFSEAFDPNPGDYCYSVYKGRNEKCEVCPVERTFEDGKPHYGEETRLTKDGTETYWLARTSPIRNAEGEITAVMEICLDITRMKQLEERLEKSESKYYAIFNHIPNAVFVLDMDTHEILDCNQSVKAVYGYTKDEIIKKSFLDLFIDQEKSYYAFKIMTSAYIKEAKHITKDGEIFPVAIRVSPSEYPGQKVLLVTTSDITKRLEAEQQLMHAGKMATLGEMATGVAHELNQPLQVIKTASSYCMKKLNENKYIVYEILYDMLEKIDRNVNRSTKIIYHMREFARKSDTVLAPVQVNDVLEKAFENFNQQFKLIGIEVAWNIENDLPMIMADPDRLEQIFTNLFLNAKDAIKKKWEHQEHAEGGKKIKLKTKFAKNKVLVEFCDTGTGIPAEIADKIFEPFFTTKEVGKGTGLGLSISYGIVKECGGDIQMTSNKDEGACFSITFPIQDIE